ncbi:hypothetical protein NL108_015468 [Boleophthalmus pectinirostris]|nr:hypothetical protein NL108_015468 [Boleophthalmus pectinirostris]
MGDHAFALQSPGPSNVISLSDLSQLIRFYSSSSSSSRNPAYDLVNNNINSSYLSHPARQTMQDDLLMDKTHHQQQQQQQQDQTDPAPSTPTPSLEPTSSSASSSDAESTGGGKEKSPMESPLLPGLGFPHQPLQTQDTGGSLSSPNSSFGSPWSTGSAVEDSYFPGMPSVNGNLLFQNFPHVNPVFGGNFTQIGLAPQSQQQQQQQQQQRRSPVSPNPGFPQRNVSYHSVSKGSCSSSSSSSSSSGSSWNNNHQNWSATPSNPWSGMQHGRDPRRAVGVGVGVGMGVGVGGMPSPLNPISPMKKPYGTGSVIAPPKFPRPLGPKTCWMDEFRADSNNILPFQLINVVPSFTGTNWNMSLPLLYV